MSSPRRLIAGVTGAAVALAVASAPAAKAEADPGDQVAAYDRIQLQARTNLLANDEGFNLPPGSSFNSITPDLNDEAQVAFRVQIVYDRATGTSRPGLWFGHDGRGGIVHEEGETDRLDNDVTLNDAGQIAYTVAANGALDNQLWTFDTASGKAEQRYSLPVTPSSHGDQTIDEGGAITYRADLGGGRGWVVTDPSGQGTLVVGEHSVTPEPYYYLYGPTANDSGQLAGKLGTDPDDYAPVEVRRFERDGTSTLILANQAADPRSPYAEINNSVSLNDAGLVAMVATRAADGKQVLLTSDGSTTTELVVAEEGGTIRSFDSFPPDVNDAGQVVFRGKDAEGQAIYVAGPGGRLTKVVGEGSPLTTDLGEGQVAQHDGSNVFGGAPQINSNGDVAFTAALTPADDDQVEWGTGVFVAYADATPPSVGTLAGDVTDEETGDPLAGARIEARGSDGMVATTSATDGRFSLDLDAGTYDVTTTHPGYEPDSQQVVIEADQTVALNPALRQSRITLTRPSTLRPSLWKDDSSTVTLTNPGSRQVDWQVRDPARWLTVAPKSGRLGPGESVDLTVTADRSAKPAGRYSTDITVSAGVLSTSTTATLVVGPADVAVNVGGAAYRDHKGVRWLRDRRLGNGHYGRVGSPARQRTRHRIARTRDDVLFRSRRVGRIRYRFSDLPPGKYRMALGFTEYARVRPGRRVFHVFVDGRRVVRRYDVARHGRRYRAVWKKVTVRHRGRGDLVVRLMAVRGRPILSAVRLREKQ